MLLAEILPNQFTPALKHSRKIPLTRFEWAIALMALARASLDGEFLHA